MGIFQAIENSASGLMAHRLRLDLISNNIANLNTTRAGVDAAGNPVPYQRQVAVLEPGPPEKGFESILEHTLSGGNGVRVTGITQDQASYPLEYNPDSPDAARVATPGLPVGYVRLPNVNIVNEMVEMLSASRAYEANVTVLNASKNMAQKALEIGRG